VTLNLTVEANYPSMYNHNIRRKKYMCSKCVKKYIEKRDLKKHQQKCTNTVSVNTQCKSQSLQNWIKYSLYKRTHYLTHNNAHFYTSETLTGSEVCFRSCPQIYSVFWKLKRNDIKWIIISYINPGITKYLILKKKNTRICKSIISFWYNKKNIHTNLLCHLSHKLQYKNGP
jgi:hypothetical protein